MMTAKIAGDIALPLTDYETIQRIYKTQSPRPLRGKSRIELHEFKSMNTLYNGNW